MSRFTKVNKLNIINVFEQKTGVDFSPKPRVRRRFATAMVACVLACCISVTAVAVGSFLPRFSTNTGDEAMISAAYQGNGILAVTVENNSNKSIEFSPKIKIMSVKTDSEIFPYDDAVPFSTTVIPANSTKKLSIDLSTAYSIKGLERLPKNDFYYIVLTNGDFETGQRLTCSVRFDGVSQDPLVTAKPVVDYYDPADDRILEQLKWYYQCDTIQLENRFSLADEYFMLCRDILENFEGRVVEPSAPLMAIKRPDMSGENVVFDEQWEERQTRLVGQNFHQIDAYYKAMGFAEGHSALLLKANIPIRADNYNTEIFQQIPILYYFFYDVNDIKSIQDYAFIRGQLWSFEELEKYKVYIDDKYVIYEVHELFYTDLEEYVKKVVPGLDTRTYVDERIMQRIKNIYNYYKENAGRLFYGIQ